METKPLLYGIIGLMLGGLIVSVAATLEKPVDTDMSTAASLEAKQGDEFDKAFIEHMIDHHEGAISMAELALENAKHEELRELSRDIVMMQQKEINAMERWQTEWGYASNQAHGEQ